MTAPSCPSSQSVRSIDSTGRDAAAAADQQEVVGARGRQREVAVGGGEGDHDAAADVVAEVGGDEALGVHLGGELERPSVASAEEAME